MGPLEGIRVIEIAGIGPGPFCAMMLADLGADVIRVERPGGGPMRLPIDVMNRSRRCVGVDLKSAEGVEVVLRLIDKADVVIEGFRPGVAERLGIGPDVCHARNERLIYGRITGWGQDGPLAPRAGHDLNYIALSGALHPMGDRDGPPAVPLNLVADFGGGGMLLAFGVVCAALEAQRSGKGQVVDAAMIDGSAALTAMFHGMMACGMWKPERGRNMLDGSAPFYTVYETKDGEHMAVGALEPKFYAELISGLELDTQDIPSQFDHDEWPRLREIFAGAFAQRTRDAWSEVFENRDACVYPVLSLSEAPEHHHNQSRSTFVEVEGVMQPAPSPRFSRTPADAPTPPAEAGAHTDEVLREYGFSEERITSLRDARTIG